MEQIEFLNQYEATLQSNIIRSCTSKSQLDGELLSTPDIDDLWHDLAPHYVADAVKEIADYPTVSLGWAMYMGMAVASMWDNDWAKFSKVENLYTFVRDIRGFDYMDEVVRKDFLGLEGDEYSKMEEFVLSCSEMVLDAIRHEQILPQSPLAFHVYARSVKVMYIVGASVWLYQLGYRRTAPVGAN